MYENCLFEIGQSSISSFHYVLESYHEIPVEVKECTFIGKLSPNAHHIDGDYLAKDLKNSKLQIKSCKFDSNITAALNMKLEKHKLLFASFKVNSQDFDVKETKQTNSSKKVDYSLVIIFTVAAVFSIVALVVITTLIRNKKEKYEENNEIITA